MTLAKAFLLLTFSTCVFSDGDLLKACNVKDIECLTVSTQTFLNQSHGGIPAYDIRPVDPFIIPALDVVLDENEGFVSKPKNVNITGLKYQKINTLEMDTKAKSVFLSFTSDLNLAGDLEGVHGKKSKTYSGWFKARINVLVNFTYNYDIKTDDKGVEHFDVGPETIDCAVVGQPELILSQNLVEDIVKDADLRRIVTNEEKQKMEFCELASVGYKTVIHNLRAISKVMPKSAFFNDI